MLFRSGRWIASQIVNKKKYKDLKVQMILNAPTDPEERLEFEAEMYAFQNRDVKDLTPIQKHGAMMVLHDPSTETLENMRKKYGFEYVASKGNREASVLGSYTETLRLCKLDNGKAAEYVFDICAGAGFDRKSCLKKQKQKDREMLSKKYAEPWLENINLMI